ncbi:protein-tyrosine phosphatase-like protein [Mortierella sp. GBAus27b]|nr:hypothetical protein BGX31_007206 [Mortierella sp. GBA43]KAI8347124.1 protein-tyrosine phosphatase-like protein [Mortierella sp. GBAus27b]
MHRAQAEKVDAMNIIKVTKVQSIQLEKGKESFIGNLHLTAFHLIFNHPKLEIWISYPTVHTVEKGLPTLSDTWPLHIRCYDFVFFTLNFQNEKDATDVYEIMQKLTCVNSVEQLHAFSYIPTPAFKTDDGWKIFDPAAEYKRMGVGSKDHQWRFSDINQSYSFSPTYPQVLVVPENISDTVLTHAAKHRSKARIPALSYLHWNKASITRSSQPMVGLKQNRSIQDERLIECIFATNAPTSTAGHPVYGSTSTNLIVDARPTANAMANTAVGAGTENIEYYKNCKKIYSGIENIHVMRDSLNKLVEALQEQDTKGAISKASLQRSGWLKHIAAVMEGGLMIVKNIHVSSSHVLVHCSDGWDRTAQLTSLAQICLDPFYRTVRGFQVLVEKEWCSFGFKFMDRCGHLSNDRNFVALSATNAAANTFVNVQNKLYNNKHIRETSPIFQQFLDCVFQVMHRNPARFEFNEYFLTRLHYHVYSCQFGNFLFNCERERRQYQASTKCSSVWDYFNSDLDQYLNPDYDPSLDKVRGPDGGVLFPEPKAVKYWAKLFGKTDAELNAIDESSSLGNPSTGRMTPEAQGLGPGYVDPLSSADGETTLYQDQDIDSSNPGPSSSRSTAARPLSVIKSNNPRDSVPSSPNLTADPDNLASKIPAFSGALGGAFMDSINRLAVNVRDSWYASTTGSTSGSSQSLMDDSSQVRDVRSSSAGPQHRSSTIGRSNSGRQRPTFERDMSLSSVTGSLHTHSHSATSSPKPSLADLTLQQEMFRSGSRTGSGPRSPPNGSASPSGISSPSPVRAASKASLVTRSDSPLHDAVRSVQRASSPDLTTTLPTSKSVADAADQSDPDPPETFNEPAKELPHPLYVG